MACSVPLPTSEEVARVLESAAFQASNHFWNAGHWNNSERLGHVATLIKAVQNEWLAAGGTGFIPLFVWIDYYFARQLPAAELYAYSQEFQAACPDQFNVDDAWIAVYARVLVQTYIGAKAEHEAILFLEKQFPGMIVTQTGDKLDRVFCVDIEVRDGEQLRYAFQLKPYSFFHGVQKQYDWAEQAVEYNSRGHQKYKEEYGVKPKYLFWSYQDNQYYFCSQKRAGQAMAS